MSRKKLALVSLAVCLSANASIWLTGCGGSSSKPVSVAVTASAATVDATDAVTLTATVTNDKNSAGVSWSVSGGGTLSNTTTTSATYTAPAASSAAQTVTVTATSVASSADTASTTLTVPAAVAITTTALVNGAVGTAYTQSLTATGGIPPYSWSLASGTLPACLTITQSASGASIGGTPNASCAGSSQVTLKVTDSGAPNALTATSAALTLAITAAPPITFPSPATLPAATYNVAYSGSVAAISGGAGAVTYSISAGALPTGLQLNTATGAITGTPTAAGTFTFTVKGVDNFGDSGSLAFSIAVTYPAITIAPATLPAGYVGSAYTQTTLSASGGSGTGYTWTVASGSALPAGLSLSTGGIISGKPTAAGTATFTVKVTDSASNTATSSLSITINAGVSITTPITLPAGYVGGSYSQTLAATGGTGTGYTWAVTSGSTLPAGLTLSSAGVLSGKPTASGTLSFSITVTDSASNTASATFSLTISGGITITTPTTLPAGYQGTAYPGATLAATGGSGTGYTWTWAAASGSTAPAGLTLSTGGAITGTPTASGTFSVVITVTDSAQNTSSSTFSLAVEAKLVITTVSPLKSGTLNAAYSQFLAASGGSGTGFTWSTNSAGTNSLAAVNLSLTPAGAVFGTPLSIGTATFTATVTDSQSHTATLTLSITIYASLTVTTTTLPTGYIGTAYSQTLAAAGGTGTGYTWNATSSNLAGYGLSLSSAGVITGTPTATGTAGFTANVTDSANNTALAPLTITIYGALALPPPNPSSLGPATLNQGYSGTISASGGSGNYLWTVTGLPANGLNSSSSGGTLTITGTPTTTTTVSFNVSVKDTTTNLTVGPYTYTIAVNSATPITLPAAGSQGSAIVNVPFGDGFNANGGSGSGYVWTVTGLSDGLTYQTSGNFLNIVGTPTATGTVTFNVSVHDGAGDTAGPVQYSIVVGSGPNGANNSYLSGTYVCELGGFVDSDSSLWASLLSFQANGAGAFSGGVFDSNGVDYTAATTGTVTGTYSVGADNNGLATFTTIPSGGSSSVSTFAIALSNFSGPTAAEFRLVETDDVGTSPSGHHGTGDCYQAKTAAFASSTISGNSFAFAVSGETSSNAPRDAVGRFSASSGTISNGYLDQAKGIPAVLSNTTFTGTYTNPSSTTGRLTLSLNSGASNFAFYIIDTGKMFMLETDAATGLTAGHVRAQKQTSYSAANLNSNFVVYLDGFDVSSGSFQGYNAEVFQGTGSGAGAFTLNESYQDDAGTFSTGSQNATYPVTFDSTNSGRVTFVPGTGSGFMYLYDNNSAFLLAADSSGGLQEGWVEAQTQTTFTDAALAGNYMLGQFPPESPYQSATVGEVNVGSSGSVSANSSNAGSGQFDWDQAQSLTYTWNSATYGTIAVSIGGTPNASCAVISATKFVCVNDTNSNTQVLIFQQ